MVEAMACGTPVIAFRSGSVPEVIDEGVTGFVVDDDEQAVQAVKRRRELDRRRVRERFEERFTAGRMAADYVSHYQSVVNGAPPKTADKGCLRVKRAPFLPPDYVRVVSPNGR
jgi:glycosyltransferase involved in cell wall biosynthesis